MASPLGPAVGPDQPGRDRAGLTRVLVVDDHESFGDLLRGALDTVPGMQCVGTATSAAEGIRKTAELRPDVVVIDVEMPHQDGLSAIREILDVSPGVTVAVMTAHRHPEWVAKAARAGASGFIPKGGSLHEMLEVIRRARPGQMLVAPSTFAATAVPAPRESGPDEQPPPRLTARELATLRLSGQGLTAADIARVLGISMHTSRGYLKSLNAKLGATTQLEAVVRAQRLGLISAPDR